MLIDRKANRKCYAIKDANGHYLAGPIADWNEGGRWFMRLPAEADTVMWVLYEAVAPGASLTVQAPYLQPFDNLSVMEGPPEPGVASTADAPDIRASVLSAARADGQLRIRLKIENTGNRKAAGAAIR